MPEWTRWATQSVRPLPFRVLARWFRATVSLCILYSRFQGCVCVPVPVCVRVCSAVLQCGRLSYESSSFFLLLYCTHLLLSIVHSLHRLSLSSLFFSPSLLLPSFDVASLSSLLLLLVAIIFQSEGKQAPPSPLILFSPCLRLHITCTILNFPISYQRRKILQVPRQQQQKKNPPIKKKKDPSGSNTDSQHSISDRSIARVGFLEEVPAPVRPNYFINHCIHTLFKTLGIVFISSSFYHPYHLSTQ